MKSRLAAVPLIALPLGGWARAAPQSFDAMPASKDQRPSDGATELHELEASLAADRVPAYLAQTVDGNVLNLPGGLPPAGRTRDLISDLEGKGLLAVNTDPVPEQVPLPIELHIPPPRTAARSAASYPEADIGGVRYYVEVGAYDSYCTTGFTVRAADGRTAVTSAGHCGWKSGQPVGAARGDAVTSGWTRQVSTVATSTWSGSGSIPGDFLTFYSSSAKGLLYQGGAPARKVTGGSNPTVGESNVCFRGATTGGSGTCGSVDSVGTLFDVQGNTYPAFCLSGAVPGLGDSGAPMYVPNGTDNASIRGIVSFGWDSDGDGTYDKGCGTPVNTVLSTTNTSLVTG